MGAPSGVVPVELDPNIDCVLVDPTLDAVAVVSVDAAPAGDVDVDVIDVIVELPLVVDELAGEKLTAPVMSNWLSGGGGTVPLLASIEAAVLVVDDALDAPLMAPLMVVMVEEALVATLPAVLESEPELEDMLPVLVPAAPAAADDGRQLLLPIVVLVVLLVAAA